jgi:hypothetical protein
MGIGLDLCLLVGRLTSNYRATEGGNAVQRSGEAQVPACLTSSAGFARCAEHECRAPALHLGGQTQELSLHRVDLDEVCRDVVIAAALPGYQAEAAARECRRRTCAA